MKRFTNMLNEPNNNSNIDNINENKKFNYDKVKFLVNKIINDNVNIVVNGGSEPYRMNHLELEGTESVSDIIVDLIKSIINNTDSDALSILENITYSKNIEHKDKVKLLFRKYKEENDILSKAKSQADRMNSGANAYARAIAAKQLKGLKEFDKSTLDEIHDIFLFRSKQLGYNNYL